MSNELDVLRTQMDDVTLKILKLLNERGDIAQQIGKLKEMQGVKRFDR